MKKERIDKIKRKLCEALRVTPVVHTRTVMDRTHSNWCFHVDLSQLEREQIYWCGLWTVRKCKVGMAD